MSEATVIEMVTGVLQYSHSQIAVAISGIAGPTGGSTSKPVGTVCIAWGGKHHEIEAKTYLFQGNRSDIRQQAVMTTVNELVNLLSE